MAGFCLPAKFSSARPFAAWAPEKELFLPQPIWGVLFVIVIFFCHVGNYNPQTLVIDEMGRHRDMKAALGMPLRARLDHQVACWGTATWNQHTQLQHWIDISQLMLPIDGTVPKITKREAHSESYSWYHFVGNNLFLC